MARVSESVGVRRSDAKARRLANELIRQNELLQEPSGDAAADFLCECDNSGCRAWVSMLPDEFVQLVDAGGFVLAEGHLLADAAAARRTAVRLQREAAALRAQAEQACRRTMQIYGSLGVTGGIPRR